MQTLKKYTRTGSPGYTALVNLENADRETYRLAVMTADKDGLTQWPVLYDDTNPEIGQIAYDNPYQIPAYMKTLTRRAFKDLARIRQARRALTGEVIPHLQYAGCLPESDSAINNASRELIRAYVEIFSSNAYLINYNPTGEMKTHTPAHSSEHYNFCASAVIPAYDETLFKLLEDRLNTPYTGTKDDYKLVTAISDRITAIGGTHLHFT